MSTRPAAAAGHAGAEVLHAPRFWPQYHPECYATFVLDPDGFRLEVAPARDARASAAGAGPTPGAST